MAQAACSIWVPQIGPTAERRLSDLYLLFSEKYKCNVACNELCPRICQGAIIWSNQETCKLASRVSHFTKSPHPSCRIQKRNLVYFFLQKNRYVTCRIPNQDLRIRQPKHINSWQYVPNTSEAKPYLKKKQPQTGYLTRHVVKTAMTVHSAVGNQTSASYKTRKTFFANSH